MVSQGNPTYDHQAGTEHLSQANEAPGDKKETATRKSLSKNHQSGNNLTMTKEEEAPSSALGLTGLLPSIFPHPVLKSQNPKR